MVLRYYEIQLKDFCEKFKPPMTKTAIVDLQKQTGNRV
jgi:hypothetical protein